MKNFILLFLLLLSSLFARDGQILTDKFEKNIRKPYLAKVEKIKNSDNYYLKAIELLDNNKNYLTKKVKIHTEEGKKNKKGEKEITIQIPKYKDILDNLKKSVEKYENPISAYISLYLMNTRFPPQNIKDYAFMRKCSELVFKTNSSCGSYIKYTKILIDGIGGKPDIKKAETILKEAKNCTNSSDWEKQILTMLSLRIERLKDKEDKKNKK